VDLGLLIDLLLALKASAKERRRFVRRLEQLDRERRQPQLIHQ
jgi:hypothetical protein